MNSFSYHLFSRTCLSRDCNRYIGFDGLFHHAKDLLDRRTGPDDGISKFVFLLDFLFKTYDAGFQGAVFSNILNRIHQTILDVFGLCHIIKGSHLQ